MIKKQVKHLVVSKDCSIGEAYWRYKKNGFLTIVVDEEGKFEGIVSVNDYESKFSKAYCGSESITNLVNKNCSVVVEGEGQADIYTQARNIFAERRIQNIPVINEEKDVIDIFTRQRAFWNDCFWDGSLERMHYAVSIYAAAKEAKLAGYKGVSICEFGVAYGDGLFTAQFHAREIGRLLNMDIQVFGFDLGSGLPDTGEEADDITHWYRPGHWSMAEIGTSGTNVAGRLYEGNELILGDIKDTIHTFFQKERYPVGAIFVDVDLYTSTKYILDWIKDTSGEGKFLPRVLMYFDDVHGIYENLGEHKALLEFNREMEGVMRISPEGVGNGCDLHAIGEVFGIRSTWLDIGHNTYFGNRLKCLHRFKDEDYNMDITTLRG